MKKSIALLFSFLFIFSTNAQSDEMKVKLDSILLESQVLYEYEKVAWNAIDLAMDSKKLKKKFGGYFVYESNDSLNCIILGKSHKMVIAQFQFSRSNLPKPAVVMEVNREFTELESGLITMRDKVVGQLNDGDISVGAPEGFNLNLVFLPKAKGYKLYILTGTSQNKLIPFGNDYLFEANTEGVVISSKKFHSRLIPTMTESPDGYKVVMCTHSHLRTTPLITATDICTFKLYAPLYDLNEFKVYSPGLGHYFTYNLKENTILIED